jgi:malate dehydrogenase (oxaloacetate-decarboxylating)
VKKTQLPTPQKHLYKQTQPNYNMIKKLYDKIVKRKNKYSKDFNKMSMEMHEKYGGKLEINATVPLNNKDQLSSAYSPGVAEPCRIIQKDPSRLKDLTINGKTIAVITDGSAVLGLGNIGPKASLPVMEGKSALFRKFGGLNSFPIALDTQDVEKFIETVKMLAPSFAGINLEDISAPRCFEIEERLKKELDIPVFHDDQHGTAIVALAGLINGLKLVNKEVKNTKIVINGSGAAGVSIAKLFKKFGFKNTIMCDSRGIISSKRKDLKKNKSKLELLKFTNKKDIEGTLKDAIKGADVFVGVSVANALTKTDVKSMNVDSIIFGLANPIPEIMPNDAKEAGAKVVATGRSDYPNQINNVLVFPGIFKGALESGAKKITEDMKIAAAVGLASLVKKPSYDKIIPNPFEKNIAETVAKAVADHVNKK